MTTIHRPTKQFNAGGKTAGKSQVSISSSGFAPIERNINCSAINSALSVPPVQGLLLPISKIAFAGYDLLVKPPEEEKANDAKQAEALKGIKLADRVVKSRDHIRDAFFDTLGYRHSLFNYSISSNEGWNLPDTFKRLPAISFEKAPDAVRNSDTLFSDHLLKGIVTDTNDDSIRFFQSQSSSGQPTEIDAEEILHIRDRTPGDLSYVASIIPTIRQWSFARSKAVMKYLERVAAPNAVGTVDMKWMDLYAAGSVPGTATMGIPDSVWTYLKNIIQAQSTDTAFVMPAGTNLEYPSLSARPPIEIDQYLIREITTHLIPVNILDTLGSSISKSSAPALELFQHIVNGWRETCARPFEEFYSKILELNGFEGWTCELDWWPLIPEDKAEVHKEYFEGLSLGAVTINEYRKAHGLPELDETAKAELEGETNTRNGGMI